MFKPKENQSFRPTETEADYLNKVFKAHEHKDRAETMRFVLEKIRMLPVLQGEFDVLQTEYNALQAEYVAYADTQKAEYSRLQLANEALQTECNRLQLAYDTANTALTAANNAYETVNNALTTMQTSAYNANTDVNSEIQALQTRLASSVELDEKQYTAFTAVNQNRVKEYGKPETMTETFWRFFCAYHDNPLARFYTGF